MRREQEKLIGTPRKRPKGCDFIRTKGKPAGTDRRGGTHRNRRRKEALIRVESWQKRAGEGSPVGGALLAEGREKKPS